MRGEITKTTIVFMFPWGALIGLAGQAVSGVLSTINNRKMQQEADAEAARQKAYYDAKANENPLSRSEVQHVLGQYDRAAQQQIENARGVAAITGATPEFAAAVQKGVAEGRANLMGHATADASKRADYYNMLGEQAQHQKALEDQQRRYERNQTYAALAANSASAVGSIMDGYSAQKAHEIDPNHESIRGANAAVNEMNQKALAAQPAPLQQEIDKMNENLAKIKTSLPKYGDPSPDPAKDLHGYREWYVRNNKNRPGYQEPPTDDAGLQAWLNETYYKR